MGYEKPKDYNEVKDRIVEFRAKFPEGSLQTDPVEWVRDAAGEVFGLTVQARAYRSPSDERPGVGTAFEFYPGKTPYTKGSEAQNAETSAWGRALIAVGAADASGGIASADEVRRVGGVDSGSEHSRALQLVVDAANERWPGDVNVAGRNAQALLASRFGYSGRPSQVDDVKVLVGLAEAIKGGE